jgi:uncharacterized protein (TIGR02594 family)
VTDVPAREPLWLSVARAFQGIAEIPGPASTPTILRWGRDIGAPSFFANDDIAWCAVFANRLALALQLPLAGRGFDLLRARSFATWGVPLAAPALGAWMVFSRPEGAHVGLYLGERADAYFVLGGNTADKVWTAWIKKERLIATRWPTGVPLPRLARVWLASNGEPVSTNEA